MRNSLVLVVALGLAAVPLAGLAVPAGAAYTWCTSFLPVEGHECNQHFACVGWEPRPYGDHCTLGLPPSCETCRLLP